MSSTHNNNMLARLLGLGLSESQRLLQRVKVLPASLSQRLQLGGKKKEEEEEDRAAAAAERRLRPPKLRHFFFAMPWVIRNEFDRFNNEPIGRETESVFNDADADVEVGLEVDAEEGKMSSDSNGKLDSTNRRDSSSRRDTATVHNNNNRNNCNTATRNQNQHCLLPDAAFMAAVSQHRRSSSAKSRSPDSPPSVAAAVYRAIRRTCRLFPQPRQPLKLPNSPSRASPSQFLDFGRKVAIVGLHGWFPNRLLHHVIGDPRRTADRIVNMMEAAVRQASDPFPPLIEGPAAIYKFPLHGEGTIEERLERHYCELGRVADAYADESLSSLEHLRTADTVILGAHSQGAPVAVMLLARLLDEGVLDVSRQRIGLFAAAGIFHGPFPPLRKNLVVQYVEAEAARQLFHLNDPASSVSVQLLHCLDRVLQAGVHVTAVASWLDQVVPFYSACLLGIEHPNLWRACHIHAQHYQPDFLTHLVQLGLKIRNLSSSSSSHDHPAGVGSETHVILAQVSDFLAGSIYRDSMHSAAYKHAAPYAAVLQWMFMGPGVIGQPLQVIDHIRQRPLQDSSAASATVPLHFNPYYLPWLFRGWLRDEALTEHPLLADEFSLLLQKYHEWQPTSKALKEFKFQLEPITLLSK